MWPFVELRGIARHVPGLVAAMDEMEMCEIASALGMHDTPTATPRTGVTSAGGRRRNLIRERMLHDRDPERYPKPEADPPDPAARQFAAEFGTLSNGGT